MMIKDTDLKSATDYSAGMVDAAYRVLGEIVNILEPYADDMTLGNEQMCNRIFSQYGLRLPKDRRIAYAYKKCLVYGVCKFIPMRTWRHQWRAKLWQDINKLMQERK